MANFVPNQAPQPIDPRLFQPNFVSNGLAQLNQYGQQQDAPPTGADLGMTAQQAATQIPSFGPGSFLGPGGTTDRFIGNIPILGGVSNFTTPIIENTFRGSPTGRLLFGNPETAGLTPGTPEYAQARSETMQNIAIGVLTPPGGGAGKATKAAASAAEKGAFELQQAIQKVIDLTRSGTTRNAALDAVEREFPKVKIGDVQMGSLHQATSAAAPFAKSAKGAAAEVASGVISKLPGAVADATVVAKVAAPAVNTSASDRLVSGQAYLKRQAAQAGQAGRTVQEQIAFKQQAALDAAGQPNPFASAPQDFSRVAGENRSITSATAGEMSPSLLTRTAQTALGTAEGGGMPEVLKSYTYPAFDAAGKRRPVGVPEAVSRAVLANDAEVVARLGPEVTQQVAQNAIAGIARKAGVEEAAIRQALQIMEHAPDRVSSEAMNAIADSVKTGKAIPSALDQMVFAAQHSALSQVGLPVTDLTTSLLRAQLVARARAAASAAAKAGDAQEALLAELRRAGVGDAQIAQDLRGMGVPASEVAKALPVLSDAERAAIVQRVNAVSPDAAAADALRTAARQAPPEARFGRSIPEAPTAVEGNPNWQTGNERLRTTPEQLGLNADYSQSGALGGNSGSGGLPPIPPTAVRAPQPSLPQRAAGAFATGMGQFLDALKTAKASMDISQLGRQGLVPVVAAALSRSPVRRIIARDAFVNALKGYGDRYAGQVWEGAMADPLFAKWKAAGGAERTIPASSLEHLQSSATRSETFKSSLLEGVPGVGGLVKASDRSFSLTLNSLAFYSWKDAYAAIKAGGRVVTDAEQKALANWYNVATGTGKVGSGELLNKIFWAPRFAISRVQAPYYAIKYLADPATREVGKLAAADLGKTAAAGIGFLKLAELAGFKVEWNTQSTDFGKVRIGNTSIDIWGGYQQPAVFAARMVTDYYIDQAGRGHSLSGGGYGGTTLDDLVTRFLESKLGPGQGLLLAFAKGKDFAGQPFGPRGGQTLAETGASLLSSGEALPLSWVDVITATMDDIQNGTSVAHGLPPGSLGIAEGAVSLTGAGIQTYERTIGRDGLGRDLKGSLPPSPVLDAWAAVRAGSEKGVKGSPSFSDLVAPDDTIGKVLLTAKEADSLAVLTGKTRDALLSQVVGSPRWATMGQVDKERALEGAKAFADRIGREQFALGLAKEAVDDTTRTRAVKVALTGADRAQTMDVLSKLQGTLTQNVKAAIDSERSVTDPTAKGYELTVDQHLQGGALVAQYLSFPAYRIGDSTVWAAASKEIGLLKTARSAMERIATSRGVPVQQLDSWKQYLADYQKTVAGFPVSRFMDLSGTVRDSAISTQRLALSQDPLWRSFKDIAEKRDPYYPR